MRSTAAFALRTSPYDSPVLSAAPHRYCLVVRASKRVCTDPTPASRTLVVDQSPPVAQPGHRHGGGVGAYSDRSRVDLDVTDAAPSSGIRNRFCVVDPPTPPTSFGVRSAPQPCGVTVTASGNHVVYGIANDQAGNESAIVSEAFRIPPLPDTTITNGPAPAVVPAPLFEFTSTPPGANFECRVDGGLFKARIVAVRRLQPTSRSAHAVRAGGDDRRRDGSDAGDVRLRAQERTVRSSCSFLVPFLPGLTADSAKPRACPESLLRPRVDVCPVRSLYRPAGRFAEDGDAEAAIAGARVVQSTRSSSRAITPSEACWSPHLDPLRVACPGVPWSGTSSLIGRGESIYMFCRLVDVAMSATPVPGSDQNRRITGEAIYKVRPVTTLAMTRPAGTVLNTFVPGPGKLVVSPGTAPSPRPCSRPERRRSRRSKPSKKVKKEGPVAVQLGLSPALAKELKTNGGDGVRDDDLHACRWRRRADEHRGRHDHQDAEAGEEVR